jgi:hypothetical protein
MPRRASKAGSTLPPLAESTAFTTVASMEGNASFRVFSACSRGLRGLGGFTGGAGSSEVRFCAEPAGPVLVPEGPLLGVEVWSVVADFCCVAVVSFSSEG